MKRLSYRFDNNQTGIEQLLIILQEVQPELVALESTGGLEKLVISQLQSAQISVAMVNPRKVRAYGIALGKAKTDAIDAQVLADFARAIRPSPCQPTDETSQQLVNEGKSPSPVGRNASSGKESSRSRF